MNSRQLSSKSVGDLKKICKGLNMDCSACVTKKDIVKLILRAQNIHPEAELDEEQLKKQQVVKRYVTPEEELIDLFNEMGLQTGHENSEISYCQQNLKIKMKSARLWYNMGVYLAQEHRMEGSTIAYLQSVKYDNSFKLPHNNLGAYFKDNMEMDKAVMHYKAALASDPKFAIALNNLAITYHVMGKLAEAQQYCKRAIEVEPNNAAAHNNLGTLVLQAGCSGEEAVKCFEKCINLDPVNSAGRYGAYSNRLLASNSMAAPCEDVLTGDEIDTHNKKIYDYHRSWGVEHERKNSKGRFRQWSNTKKTDRPLRVGYVSSDLRRHPISYWAFAPMNYMDDKTVEVWIYFNGGTGDERTQQLRTKIPNSRWKPLIGLSTMACCEMIRRDKIDILIELGGHSAGNRQDIMVLKPAPVQCTWIGYPNTTGLSCIDWRITDSVVDPPYTHQQFSEKLYRMPEPCAFLCYSGTHEANAQATGAPALKTGYITYGSFNALHKLTDQGFELWSDIMAKVPNSHLFWKCKPFASEGIRERYLKRFEAKGISRDRIKMVTHVPSRADHLNLYKTIDVALDPFPYAGTTTTAEALWMGVPVVTLQRMKFPIHAQNVGASFSSRIPSLKKFVAKTKKEYVDIGVYWGQKKNWKELNRIKANLRKDMAESPLANGPLFCEKLTEVYQDMWKQYCEKDDA